MDKEEGAHIYTGILLTHKQEWNIAICSNMYEPRDYHTKWSKSDKDTWYHLYVKSKKKNTSELIYKTEIDSQTLKTNMVIKGERGER